MAFSNRERQYCHIKNTLTSTLPELLTQIGYEWAEPFDRFVLETFSHYELEELLRDLKMSSVSLPRYVAMLRLVCSGTFHPEQDFRKNISLEMVRAIHQERKAEMKELLESLEEIDFDALFKS